MEYATVKGDLVEKALNGEFNVVVHGVNCFCTQKSGLAPQMVKTFGTDKFSKEHPLLKGDINKLGDIEYKFYGLENNKAAPIPISVHQSEYDLVVINAYTQYNYGENHRDGVSKPLDYEALTLCMRKINHIFAGKKIGMPKIGCGLAGGDWNVVEKIIKTELKNCNVVIVEYDK